MKELVYTTIILTAFFSCAQHAKKPEIAKPATEVLISEVDNKLVNKYWKLNTLEGKAVEMAENQEREQYFILKSDGTLTGFSGCNVFNGQFELSDGNRIRFHENLCLSMKACPDVDINESDFMKVFEVADNYTFHEDTLHLNVGKRASLGIFEAVYF